MAEYNEVIKQFKRMCRYYYGQTYGGCPLYYKGHGCNISHCRKLAFDDKKFQNVVMAWAAEHPVVYPTWYEFMRENKIIPDVLEDCGDYYKTIGKWLVKATIKHDIAQKLGIDPKEG